MYRLRHRVSGVLAIVALTVALWGCATAPSPSSRLRFTTSIDRTTIGSGETATLTFQLENMTDDTIAIPFPDSCQMLPFVSNHQTAAIVYPAAGAWGCAQVQTTLELQPRGATTRQLLVRAGTAASASELGLPPGRYGAYATLGQASLAQPLTIVQAGQFVELPNSARLSSLVSFTVQ